MKKVIKAVGISAALAVMIPLSAYAASSVNDTKTTAAATVNSTKTVESGNAKLGRGHGSGFGFGATWSQPLLDLLKLDKEALKEKLSAGSTLAEVAEAQGVTREQLKQVLNDEFKERQAEQLKQFETNLDSMVDGKLGAFDKLEGKGGGALFGKGIAGALDTAELAKLLGMTEDALKESLAAGKSLADLAQEKGVDAAKVTEALKSAAVKGINTAVTDGKLTQEQADKQIENLDARIEKIVNSEGFKGGLRGGHGGGGHGRGAAEGQTAVNE
ncbi:hypothetical protein K0T92_16875 [Paenibacillus oenotherae]|uniref:Uncharacterized protein n=1 Tax=Paenibacillus oenotherae TaxID=1435645 RepID=A0ABS7DB68_9BACL|nr:hypothetical protein [Paenibacillus oenotherae]MBW7476408.1 hypothetical protein [Paenibacillus oenotherae]